MNRMMMLAIAVLAAFGLPAGAADVTSEQLDKAFQTLTTFKIGNDTGDVDVIRSAVVRYAKDEPRRADLERRLIQVLRGQATYEAKDLACRQLFILGTEAGVPALSDLLQDERLSHAARAVLEKIPGDAATQALRDALARAKDDAIKIGCIHSLARRGDGQSIDAFVQCAKSDRPELAGAAILALSRLDHERADEAVAAAYGSATDKTRSAAADALLAVAARQLAKGKADKAQAIYERLYGDKEPAAVRVAAMQGLIRLDAEKAPAVLFKAMTDKDAKVQAAALSAVRESGSVSVAAIGQEMPRLPASVQAKLILAMAVRGAAARPIVLQAVQSKDETVRVAAVKALASVGDASCVGLLGEIAASKDKAAEAARASLVRLAGGGINQAIVDRLKAAKAEVQVELVNALAGRGAAETTASLLDLAASENPRVRQASFAALKRLAGGQQAPALARLLLKGPEGSEAEEAEAAAVAACRRISDAAGQAAPVVQVYAEARSANAKASLLRVMGKLGGKEAAAVVQAAVGEADKAVKDAAIRALVDWPDAQPIQAVRRLAESADDPTHRILALRGFIRMIEMADLAENDVLNLYDAAMKLATRPDEKRQILARIADVPCEAAMKIAQACENDPALATDAKAAAERIDQAMKQPPRCTASTEADVDKAVDGNPATRWTSGRPMQGGEWFMLDMGGQRTIKQVTLDCQPSAGDYPRGYEVYVSNSRTKLGQAVAKGEGKNAVTEIIFPPTSGRYVKIVQTGKAEGLYWSIHELRVE